MPSRLQSMAKGVATVDVKYINPFVESVDNVFQMMLNVTPQRQKLKLGTGQPNGAAVTSLVGISGKVQGVVVLRLPHETALELAKRMLGTEVNVINAEVVDAVSEIVNMIAGSAKAKFEYDPPLELGLPTVVQGNDYNVKYPSGTTWLEIPFESEAGNFSMELTFEEN